MRNDPILNLDKSYQRFFKKQGGFPKFKSKKRSKPSFTIPQNTEVDFESGIVTIPKFKSGVKCNFHRHFSGDIKSSTISQLPNGKYEISILVNTRDENGDEIQYPTPININTMDENQAVGIDMGLKDFLITSDNDKISNPTFLRRSLKRLKRTSKRHSKRTKIATKIFEYNSDQTPILTKTGKHKYHLSLSKNCKKSQKRLTLLHYKVSCQRKDFLHKQSHKLANSSFNCFAVETLRVKNMIQNRKLSRAISDVSWSSFITMLEYKLKWNSKDLVKIDCFYPSSKLCNICQYKNTELKLSNRSWICQSCSAVHDRDINAAINIKNQGYNLLSQLKEKDQVQSQMPFLNPKGLRKTTVRSTVE